MKGRRIVEEDGGFYTVRCRARLRLSFIPTHIELSTTGMESGQGEDVYKFKYSMTVPTQNPVEEYQKDDTGAACLKTETSHHHVCFESLNRDRDDSGCWWDTLLGKRQLE